jgi:TPR repeat protein
LGVQTADVVRAFSLYQKACDLKSAWACGSLANAYGSGRKVSKDVARAVPYYERACDLEPRGGWCKGLGEWFERGLGVQVDITKAAHYYQKGCEGGGNNPAGCGCDDLARLLQQGAPGIVKDPKRALELYLKICDASGSGFCTKAAEMILSGSGTNADPLRAAELFRRDCDRKHPEACIKLAGMYESGAGMSPDPEKAASYYSLAIETGQVYCHEYKISAVCRRVADLCAAGKGCSDRTRAKPFYQKACELGDQTSCGK